MCPSNPRHTFCTWKHAFERCTHARPPPPFSLPPPALLPLRPSGTCIEKCRALVPGAELCKTAVKMRRRRYSKFCDVSGAICAFPSRVQWEKAAHQQLGSSNVGPGQVCWATECGQPEWRCCQWVHCRPVASPGGACGATFSLIPTFWRRLRRCKSLFCPNPQLLFCVAAPAAPQYSPHVRIFLGPAGSAG
eukprot:gene8849-biopygen9208